jgi:hypothetical protein
LTALVSSQCQPRRRSLVGCCVVVRRPIPQEGMSPVRGSSLLTADRLASRPPTHSSCPPSCPFVAPAGCCLSFCLCCWHLCRLAPAPTPLSHWCRHRYCASIFANRRHRHCRRPLPPSNAAVNRRSHPPPPQSNYISLSPCHLIVA